MDMQLTTDMWRSDGIFGTLKSKDASFSCLTLEHSYENDDKTFGPKLPAGVYKCVRGTHTLHNGISLECFELQNVPGHTGMLIHPGNYNDNSDGCILVGRALGWKLGGQIRMITYSDQTFKELMQLQDGQNEFQLTVLR